MAESPPGDGDGAGMLVVEAPMDSEPTTPVSPVIPDLGSLRAGDAAEETVKDEQVRNDSKSDLSVPLGHDSVESGETNHGHDSRDKSQEKLADEMSHSEKASAPKAEPAGASYALPTTPLATTDDDDDDGLAAWMEHDEQLAEPGAKVVTSEGMAQ